MTVSRLGFRAQTALAHGKYGIRWASSSAASKRPKTALFFPGQGTQRVGMATEWLEAFPRTVRPVLEQIDDTLKMPLTRTIADGPNSALLATENDTYVMF